MQPKIKHEKLSPLDNMKQSKFRYLNELLYTQDSAGAVDLFKTHEQFEDYHEGYRQ